MSETTREQLEAELVALRSQNAAQAGEIDRLTRMITELEQRLDKGSKNPSVPPSADSPKKRAEATKTRADRRADVKAKRKDDVDRRRGIQPETPGANLAMRPDPDEIVNHLLTNCGSCGDDLADAPVEDTEYRQVFDIPKPVLGCVEHRAVTKRCRCGATTKGTFPASAKAPASYGPNVRASALYLLMGQHLPVERTAHAMAALLGTPVSTGFIASLANEASDGLVDFIDELKERRGRRRRLRLKTSSPPAVGWPGRGRTCRMRPPRSGARDAGAGDGPAVLRWWPPLASPPPGGPAPPPGCARALRCRAWHCVAASGRPSRR